MGFEYCKKCDRHVANCRCAYILKTALRKAVEEVEADYDQYMTPQAVHDMWLDKIKPLLEVKK